MVEILVPIFICVVMPVAIVFIVFRAATNNDNKRAEVLIKAIESNNSVDADKLAEALSKPHKTAREILNSRLLRGCICTFLGVAALIYGIYALCVAPNSDVQHVAFIVSGTFLAIGLGFLVTYFITREQVDKDEEDREQ